jgi:hypothetical protein
MKSRSTPPEAVAPELDELPDEGESPQPALERERRRLFWKAALLLVLWPALGVALMAWGFQMDDQQLGSTLFNAGVIGANLGIAGTLVWAYIRWVERD